MSDQVAIAHRQAGMLTTGELFWRDRYDWLQRSGYMLRDRYAPNWIPSWTSTGKPRWRCEDGINLLTTRVIDAVRTKDGETVAIKHYSASTHPHESGIALYLSSPLLSTDSRNHCCPILEVLQDPLDPDQQLIVMPLLRVYNDPKFATVGEAVEFFRQAFEGLQFMHESHVAHRDISKLNVMMDPKPILPELYHPQQPWRMRHAVKDVRPYTRTAHPVRYYYTDFGLSRRYDPNDTNPSEVPILGGDKTVPEFQDDPHSPRNPFHTDVYYLGNLIRCDFIQTYTNFTFMDPLITRMVQDAPEKRPTMSEVVAEFSKIMKNLTFLKTRQRLVKRTDSRFMNLLKNVHYLPMHAIPNLLICRPSIATPKDYSVPIL